MRACTDCAGFSWDIMICIEHIGPPQMVDKGEWFSCRRESLGAPSWHLRVSDSGGCACMIRFTHLILEKTKDVTELKLIESKSMLLSSDI